MIRAAMALWCGEGMAAVKVPRASRFQYLARLYATAQRTEVVGRRLGNLHA